MADMEIPDEEGLSGFGDVVNFIKPFLNPDKADQAVDLLHKYGVTTRSELLVVIKFPHMESVMNLVNFTKMMDSLKLSDESSNGATQLFGYSLNLSTLLSKSLFGQLKGENILSHYNRRKVLNMVVDDMYENKLSTITLKYLKKVADNMVEKYPKAFGCIDQTQMAEATSSVRNSMVYHLRYLQRTNKERGGIRRVAQANRKFNKSHNYGLVNDLPEASEEDEPNVFENRRKLLVTMYEAGDFNEKVFFKQMKESYIPIRLDINEGLNMEDLLVKWPFLGNAKVLTDHFSKLCEKPSNPDLTFLAQWVEFFSYLSHQTRRGAKKDIPMKLAKIVKNWDKKEETAIIVTLLCILVHLEIPEEDLFIKFDETTSFDELQASDSLPDHGRPVLGLLGSEPLKNPKAYLIVEKRCTSQFPTTTATALVHLIMSYFIFKIPYSSRAAPVLDFMQRKILSIESSDGSKVERKRTEKGWGHASPDTSAKYIMLIRDFNHFAQTYLSAAEAGAA